MGEFAFALDFNQPSSFEFPDVMGGRGRADGQYFAQVLAWTVPFGCDFLQNFIPVRVGQRARDARHLACGKLGAFSCHISYPILTQTWMIFSYVYLCGPQPRRARENLWQPLSLPSTM